MRYLRPFNEAIENPALDKFIDKLLEYKSEFIENIKIKDHGWEIRMGYAPRKTITFDNKILNKQESISIEDHRASYGSRSGVRVFWNNSYQFDVSYSEISNEPLDVVKRIFSVVEKSSKGVKDYFRQMEIAKDVLSKISEDEIKENFIDVIDMSRSHNIELSSSCGYQKWKVTIEFSKRMFNLKSPGLEIDMNSDNQVIIQEIISASNRIRERYNILTTVVLGQRDITIDLNAIDPTTGKKIG